MLTLEGVGVAYQKHQVVQDVSFSLSSGQIGCLLGPSGCGKTSLLRAIAGFEPVSHGKVLLRDQQVSSPGRSLSPEKRKVAMVFQDFALFPHLTIAQNVGFGLHKLDASTKHSRVEEMLALVGLNHLSSRFPYELSGGQQQRVALARALAPKPDLLLLDEPFSSLDADMREELAREIRDIIRHENTTALMVTHDQHEAFAMADNIGVLNAGQLQQWGTAYALYHQPANLFVADFVGAGVFIPATVTDEQQLHTALGILPMQTTSGLAPGDTVKLLVRPDDILHDDDSPTLATVKSRVFRGAHILYRLALHGHDPDEVLCLAPSHHDHAVGEQFGIRLDLEHLVFFPA